MLSQVEREAAAIGLLDRWPWNDGGCLIGGYAVAAYGKARFSQDLDIVLPKSRREPSVLLLKTEGFGLRSTRKVQPRFSDALTMLRGDFSVDLMFGSVRDRETGASIEAEWISAGARRLKLDLLTGTTSKDIAVARPAAIWVLKLVAGRDQDLSDLFAISGEPFDPSEVRHELEEALNPALREKLSKIPSRLATSKIYSDALSTRSMGKRQSPENLKSWSRFRDLLELTLPR